LEQFHFSLFQSWCRCELGIYTFAYSLSSLYCAHFWKKIKNLLTPISVLIFSFVDDRLFVSQEKSYKKSNTNLFYSYNIISFLFSQFSLVIEHNKLEVFHFLRLTKNINPSSLDLCPLGGPILYPKDMWCYLKFFFDKKLLFCQHIHYYSNKALSMIKSMKMLDNSTRELSLIHKWLLYKICALPIAFSALIFQKSTTLSTAQEIKENTDKSSFIDHRNILYLTNMKSRGYN